MQTICRLSSFVEPDVSLYLLEDDVQVTIKDDRTVVGDPVQFTILDCDSSNCILYTNVVQPSGWYGWKYKYNSSAGWVLNPNWVDPNAENT